LTPENLLGGYAPRKKPWAIQDQKCLKLFELDLALDLKIFIASVIGCQALGLQIGSLSLIRLLLDGDRVH